MQSGRCSTMIEGVEHTFALPWPGGEGTRRYFEDAELKSLHSRASAYLRAGVAVRFQGPAGMGKTTLALRVANGLGRPVSFVTGHASMTPEDLIGREVGQSASRVEDKYIASVRRTETRVRADWQAGVLAAAMTDGATLVYDEFTRAPAEVNAALLSVLEEGVLAISHPAEGTRILRAHPQFRLILTSNPADYRGVHEAPDALLDRFVTFDLESVSAETETGIVASATGLARDEAGSIVCLVRALRSGCSERPSVSMRTAILIARLMAAQNVRADRSDPRFVQICADVLRGRLDSADIERLIADGLAIAAHTAPPRRSAITEHQVSRSIP
jgi:gas vesicle protein GvpN